MAHTSRSQPITEGKPGEELKAGTCRQECCLPVCSPWLCQPVFNPRPSTQGWHQPAPTSIIIEKMPPQTCLQTNVMGPFSQLRFPLHTSLAFTKLTKPAQSTLSHKKPESLDMNFMLTFFSQDPVLMLIHNGWISVVFMLNAEKYCVNRRCDCFYGTR